MFASTMGCVSHDAQLANTEPPPTDAEIALLEQIVKDCQLHPGALSFEKNDMGGYDVRINRGYSDPEEQIGCATRRLPYSFMRFGLGPIVDTIPKETGPTH